MKTLEGRLQVGLGLSLLLLMACGWWLGHRALHGIAEVYVLSRLQHDAEALVAALVVRPDTPLHIGPRRLTPIYNQPYSGHYFVLRTADGREIRSRSLWDAPMQIRDLAPGQQTHWHASGPSGQKLLVWGGGFRRGDLHFSIAVGEDVTPLSEELHRFEGLLGALAVGGLLLLVLVQRLVLYRTFRKLQPLYRDIERLEHGEAVSLTEAVPGEVLPLVRKLNRLLELLAQRLQRSRTAAGNLAHALKTPLNLMVQQLSHAGDDLAPETARSLDEQITRIRRLIDRELKRARFAGAALPGSEFAPCDELPDLARLLERMYPVKGLAVACRIHRQAGIAADREDMLELLGNLLDNACKWARSQVACTVEETDDGGVLLAVEDDGPGCSETELARITERGVRLDESVDGHGLGLAIARDIVGLYKGRLELDRSPDLGGLRARIILPPGVAGG